MTRDWAAEREWVEGIVTRMLTSAAEGIADAEREIAAEERAAMRRKIEERAAKSDAAAIDLILELQRKIADLEKRAVLKPTRPQLVAGDPDAA